MGKKKKAENRALRAAIRSWLWWDSTSPLLSGSGEGWGAARSLRTEFTATVFSGEATDWVRYLTTPVENRYQPDLRVQVHLQPELRLIAFEPQSEASRWLSDLLKEGFHRLFNQLRAKPNVLVALQELLFDNRDNQGASLNIRLSTHLPGEGTREVDQDSNVNSEVRLVLNGSLVQQVRARLEPGGSLLEADERLGVSWPVLARLIASIAYPSRPRDLFVAKIRVQAKLIYIAINLLYESKQFGVLVPSRAGRQYSRVMSEISGLEPEDVLEVHPFFRTLQQLGFMLRAQPYRSYEEDACIVAREYLDRSYLRLSLAGAMPETPFAMRSMDFERNGGRVKTPNPEVGRFGILDAEDLDGWKALSSPLGDLGFTPLRQLGIGEFGRVYEVLNEHNPELPERLALKVDRIVGKKSKAILEAEAAMSVGRALARSPHVIRLYDTGKLSGKRYTYHVLQLIDGDTLDNLIGVTGTEHASVSRPPAARISEVEILHEYEQAISSRGGELWRRRRVAAPFVHTLSPTMLLELLTSVLLWLEEVHELGYSINDLKNGNLMMSRRGQLKGIDLDSYAPVHSPKDKMTDFMFLAVSLILLVFSAPTGGRRNVSWEKLIESEGKLRTGLNEAWPFGDVETLSEGRVTREELMELLVDLVQCSRQLAYAKHPDRYSKDIDRLASLKRRLLVEEMVID